MSSTLIRCRRSIGSHESRGGWVAAAFMSAAAVILLVAAGCRQNGDAPKPGPIAAALAPSGGYAGNEACADCHSKAFREHKTSGHAQTLRVVDTKSMGSDLPPSGPIPGTDYTIRQAGERLVMASPGKPDYPLDMAFGSGNFGISFASMAGRDSFDRLKMSWLPATKQWVVSPGMERGHNESPATREKGEGGRGCVLCHAVMLPPGELKPEVRFMGVGCESCHGPCADHIVAARMPPERRPGGRDNLRVALSKGMSAMIVNNGCGACHAASLKDAGTVRTTGLLKFQVDAINSSQCFVRSLGRLSCVDCHDPHAELSKDTRHYEAVCLKCHDAKKPATSADSASHGNSCPVNSRDGCIPCHMPKRRIFPGTKIPTRMTDHLLKKNTSM